MFLSCVRQPGHGTSAFSLHIPHRLCHEPAKPLRLKGVGTHLVLSITALKGKHVLEVLGLGEFTRQREMNCPLLNGF
jgi:hypothetical protein